MRKQFDLQYHIEHPETKVITRDGRDVKILCTDLRDPKYPIAATYINLSGIGADIESYTSEGKVIANASIEHSRDLFFDMPDQYVKKVPLTHEDLQERVKAGKTMWAVNSRRYHQVLRRNIQGGQE